MSWIFDTPTARAEKTFAENVVFSQLHKPVANLFLHQVKRLFRHGGSNGPLKNRS